jgi:hypothetical protein
MVWLKVEVEAKESLRKSKAPLPGLQGTSDMSRQARAERGKRKRS